MLCVPTSPTQASMIIYKSTNQKNKVRLLRERPSWRRGRFKKYIKTICSTLSALKACHWGEKNTTSITTQHGAFFLAVRWEHLYFGFFVWVPEIVYSTNIYWVPTICKTESRGAEILLESKPEDLSSPTCSSFSFKNSDDITLAFCLTGRRGWGRGGSVHNIMVLRERVLKQ